MSRELTPQEIAERSLIKKYRKELWNPFIAAVKRYGLIVPGDRIAVCISGGKDSMVLAKLMQELTSTINEDSTELKIREGRVPTATVTAQPYNYLDGRLPVLITDLANADTAASTINVAVWTEEDRSDQQWIQAELQVDGTYLCSINVANFGFKLGQYNIEAYLIDNTGTQYLLGSTTGLVEE